MKTKKKINVIIFILIALIIISSVVCIILKKNNDGYPEKYIGENYPDAEIICISQTGDRILNAYKKTYACLDKEHNFVFYQDFSHKGWLLKLDYADKDENDKLYDEVLKKSEALSRCTSLACEKTGDKCVTRINPDNSAGFIVFMDRSDFDLMLESATELDKIVKDEYQSSGVYVKYTAIACDKSLLDVIKKSDEEPLNSIDSTADVAKIIKTFSGMDAQHIGTYDQAEFTQDDSQDTLFAVNGENNKTDPHKIMTYKII